MLNKFIRSSLNIRDTKYYLYQYNDEQMRVVKLNSVKQKGWEEVNKTKKQDNFIRQEEIDRVSISRTRRNIRELALSNNFEYFATLTINSINADRFSLTQCQELLRQKLKKLKRNNKNFGYLFITEKHKDGAFHFHGLIKGVQDFYINKNGYLSNRVFDEIGFNSFSKIKDYAKCCNYITKYITKDCVRNEAGTVYISSRGLKKALKSEIREIDLDWQYKNEYCSIKDFNISETSKEDLLKLMYIN